MTVKSTKWKIEGLGWLLTLGITGVILLPIYLANIQFDWFLYNVFFLIGGLTVIRYLFSFHYRKNKMLGI